MGLFQRIPRRRAKRKGRNTGRSGPSQGRFLRGGTAARVGGSPGGQGQPLHGPEHPVLQPGVAAVELEDQLLHLLPPGGPVGGAGVVDHREGQPLGGVGDHGLAAVEQGPDLGDPGAVQEGHRLEAAQPPLVDQGHEEGLHRVVVVVAQGDLGEPPLRHSVVQRPPAHLGTHGAGVLLLPELEDDPVDLGGHHGIGHVQLPAPGRHRAEVHPRDPQVQGDGLHGEGARIELPQPGQGGQQGQRVLAAGHPHRHAVAGLDHVVVLHTAADQGEDLVHKQPPSTKKNVKSNLSIQENRRDKQQKREFSKK